MTDLGMRRADVVSPSDAVGTFSLPPGFEIQLVAAEPLVTDPVAMAFDARGRLWVAEMPTFDMLSQRELAGPELGGARVEPKGRVVMLEDTDGDGRMDKRTVFLDNLEQPNAVGFMGDGVLVGHPPRLLLCYDRNGDGVADDVRTIATDYISKSGNIEDSPNGLLWGLDNWLYNAEYTSRLRPNGETWVREPMPILGQWGITQDQFGRLIYNHNSDQLRGSLSPSHYVGERRKGVSMPGVNSQIAADQTIWPQGPTPGVGRGYRKGELRDDGSQSHFTGACAPLIYSGSNFPDRYLGNAFVAEPSANLIRRNVIFEAEGRLQADNAFERAEFLTSTDERFRPVWLSNGPDGALYIVDMYRGILSGWPWMTTYLRDQILQRGLHLPPWGLGRIYRVVSVRKPLEKAVNFAGATDAQLVGWLSHPNGWTRDTAQRKIVESNNAAGLVPELEKVLTTSTDAHARLRALWCLDGLQKISVRHLAPALNDVSPHVRMAALRIAEPFLAGANGEALLGLIRQRIDSEEPVVLVQMVLSLSAAGAAIATEPIWAVLPRAAEHPALLDAIAVGLRSSRAEILQRMLAMARDQKQPAFSDQPVFRMLAEATVRQGDPGEQGTLVALISDANYPRWVRASLVRGLCAAAALDPTSAQKRTSAAKLEPNAILGLANLQDTFLLRLAQPLVESVRREQSRVVKKVPVAPLTAVEQELFEIGRKTYATCAVCHQPDGNGREGVAPPLVGSQFALASSYHVPARIVLNGKEGTPGYPAAMAELSILSDKQIAGVLTYIRRSWGNEASAVTPEDVAHVRTSVRSRYRGWTNAELEAVASRFR